MKSSKECFPQKNDGKKWKKWWKKKKKKFLWKISLLKIFFLKIFFLFFQKWNWFHVSGWLFALGDDDFVCRYDTMATHEEKHRLALTSPPPPTTPSPRPVSPKIEIKIEHVESKESNGRLVKSELPEPQNFEEKRFFCHPMLSRMHFTAEHPCPLQARCRLAEREHFHCDRCDFAYTSPLRLQTHLNKCRVSDRPPPEVPRNFSRSPSFAPSVSPRPALPLQAQFSVNSDTSFSPKSSPPSSSSSFLDFDLDHGHQQQRQTHSSDNTNTENGHNKIKFISMAFPPAARVNGPQQLPIPDGNTVGLNQTRWGSRLMDCNSIALKMINLVLALLWSQRQY